MQKRTITKITVSGLTAFLALELGAQSTPVEKVNLAENGSFENGVKPWAGPGTNDSAEFTDGKASLKLDGAAKKVFLYDSQEITKKLKPSTEYILSVDIKRTTTGKGAVYAAVLEKENASDKDWKKPHACGGQGQAGKWERFEVKFTTGPEIGSAIIILYNINTEGTVWYDNVSLVEAK